MSACGWPDGFIANMKWRFDGNIPAKVWKDFRTKFAAEHSPGWEVRKNYSKWTKRLVVSFRTDVPAVAATMPPDQWDFLKATLSLLAVKET